MDCWCTLLFLLFFFFSFFRFGFHWQCDMIKWGDETYIRAFGRKTIQRDSLDNYIDWFRSTAGKYFSLLISLGLLLIKFYMEHLHQIVRIGAYIALIHPLSALDINLYIDTKFPSTAPRANKNWLTSLDQGFIILISLWFTGYYCCNLVSIVTCFSCISVSVLRENGTAQECRISWTYQQKSWLYNYEWYI